MLSPALGDSLLMMTIARNLRLAQIAVTAFGSQMQVIKDWFPDIDIRPDLTEDRLDATLPEFDAVIQMHRDRPFVDLHRLHPRVILLEPLYRARSPEAMADRLARFCKEQLGLTLAGKSNGITAPPGLEHRRHSLRVAIHPTASTSDKCWLPSRFLRLALQLRERGFQPQFVVAPQERAEWRHVERSGLTLPHFDSLHDVATWLYESGWFIGNDSGIGHLASSLQVPTLSLFMRRGIARTWRPGWGSGQVLVGSSLLPTGRLRERYWKYMLSVGKVTQAFDQLRAEFA
ncbi:MAG TPA: glycosyltransferase family 9 protein [Trinickia sp.]|nr:glycosyltransferase family 9 protein [Trinickia sp.]